MLRELYYQLMQPNIETIIVAAHKATVTLLNHTKIPVIK